jgi:hypothetical protein
MTTLILNPRRETGARPPAREAGRGEDRTRNFGRLPGETPGTDLRLIRAEVQRQLSSGGHLEPVFFFPRKVHRVAVVVNNSSRSMNPNARAGRMAKIGPKAGSSFQPYFLK